MKLSLFKFALFSLFVLSLFPIHAFSQKISLSEKNIPGQRTQVDLKVELNGQALLPAVAGKKEQKIEIIGQSSLKYDERILPKDDDGQNKVLRQYREVAFNRTVNGEKQSQEIRQSVRRMVVMQSPMNGVKAPFSPDGPLTNGEIDAVRVDLFSPVIVSGVLPAKSEVQPGDEWKASEAAVLDLTGLEKLESGEVKVKYVNVVVVQGKRQHRLSLYGTVKGLSEDGPTQHDVDATAYFDEQDSLLSYLSLKGNQTLLNSQGKAIGSFQGRMTLTRSLSNALSDREIEKIELKPTAENSLLLFENVEAGITFTHPRHWRVTNAQGEQIMLESSLTGSGMLLTIEPAKKLPTADAFLQEAKQMVAKQKGRWIKSEAGQRVNDFDRFAVDVEFDKKEYRMEYAVGVAKKGAERGLSVALRCPNPQADEMKKELDRLLKDIYLK